MILTLTRTIFVTTVRYAVTPTANAMGPSYVDPRSGEILVADVIWYHNVISLVHDWRFVQTEPLILAFVRKYSVTT